MPLTLDPEIAAFMASAGDPPPPHRRGDWRGLRALSSGGMGTMMAGNPRFPDGFPDVRSRDAAAYSANGTQIPLRWYAPAGVDQGDPGPAVVYAHGGGLVAGSLEHSDASLADHVTATGVPFLAVDYRLAPERGTGVQPAQDVFAALEWLVEHADEFGVDPGRVAVMGDSAGGGIAAGAALLARDAGVAVARQILQYPMLDDRTVVPDLQLEGLATWSWDMNWTAWHALLGELAGTDDVPPVAVPARAADLSGLAPAYLEVGELDILRDETIEYARRLAHAGVSAELHVHPGAVHGFDRFVPDAAVSRRSLADRRRVLANL